MPTFENVETNAQKDYSLFASSDTKFQNLALVLLQLADTTIPI